MTWIALSDRITQNTIYPAKFQLCDIVRLKLLRMPEIYKIHVAVNGVNAFDISIVSIEILQRYYQMISDLLRLDPINT